MNDEHSNEGGEVNAAQMADWIDDLKEQIETLKRENVELRQDKERMDKIILKRFSVSYNERISQWVVQCYGQVVGNIGQDFSLRAALDASTKAEAR